MPRSDKRAAPDTNLWLLDAALPDVEMLNVIANEAPPMKLYHTKGSRSVRVLWLLEELGLDYEIEVLPFDPKALSSTDHFANSPFGKVPVLVDDGATMFESVAIVQYLLEHYADGRLEPDRSGPDYGMFLQWMQFGESTLMGPVSNIIENTELKPEEERRPEAAEQGRRAFGFYAKELDGHLKERSYLIDDSFTAADIVVGYALHVAETCHALPESLPSLRAYYRRLAARPAFQKAVAD